MINKNYESKSDPPSSDKRPGAGFETQLDALEGLTQEQRDKMIAEAAYYIAERHHFQGGAPIDDWLQAQVEIDCHINGTYRVNRSSEEKNND